MAGTHRFQNWALRANPCIISTGVESSHGHRKSSTVQWTDTPSGKATRGIGYLPLYWLPAPGAMRALDRSNAMVGRIHVGYPRTLPSLAAADPEPSLWIS